MFGQQIQANLGFGSTPDLRNRDARIWKMDFCVITCRIMAN